MLFFAKIRLCRNARDNIRCFAARPGSSAFPNTATATEVPAEMCG